MARATATKAERREARGSRARRPQAEDSVEQRLARIEEALARQAEASRELADRIALAGEALRAAAGWSEADPLDGLASPQLGKSLLLRRETVEPVDQPLALICQAQRSGGTLLARLFDGHPECHAHPHELHIGHRRPHLWPELPLDEDPSKWFEKLEEAYASTFFARGRRRIPLKAPGEIQEGFYPFMLPPEFQRVIFLDEVERRRPITSERQILDCYMTSLFNGWLDNQSLRGGREKKWVVAFSPRRAWGNGLTKYFKLYPEGRMISILRDPLSWYSSAQGRDPGADAGELLELWRKSATEMLRASRRYKERVQIIRFDELVLKTEDTMRLLAEFLEIDFDPVLATPTFNGYPVGANSSFAEDRTGVVADPVERYKEVLSDEQTKLVRDKCDKLYEQVVASLPGAAPPRAPRQASRAAPR